MQKDPIDIERERIIGFSSVSVYPSIQRAERLLGHHAVTSSNWGASMRNDSAVKI